MEKKTVVTGVIGFDAHIVGSTLLSYALTQAGFKVVSLGSRVSQEEFIEAAVESNAQAILVSSIYGMGILDCEGFREKCDEAGLKNITLYIGGLLEASKQSWEVTQTRFKEMGFDRVYPPDASLTEAISDLKKDLGLVST